ncbi:probable nucleoside-diphosphate-sugar epimerases [Cephalotrichum gorgonifer]|uniref:Probable nucleoside-diphosphate-sugar epimerases n=1 Tax=Cephalotrichum gorgonifer TaxID=2041049 RepID=A0AAE8MZJ1_9PEZI|nr:probable nucleoside-diphosphate-sugar epimerases [Cephalotrichum gorgonifer]
MHLILTGATGLVGSAVLDAMIKAKDVSKISILSRRPVKMADDAKDPRVNVILHKDFEKYDASLLDQLKDANGVVWALGISQSQVTKEEYVKITKDYALAAAKAFQKLPKDDPSAPFEFVYVSGEGTTHDPGYFTQLFARVKGETEKELAEMRKENPLFHASSVRPAFVDAAAHESIREYIPKPPMALAVTAKLFSTPIRVAAKGMWSPTEPLGQFLTGMAAGKFNGQLQGPGVQTLGAFPVISNVAFRRLMGL